MPVVKIDYSSEKFDTQVVQALASELCPVIAEASGLPLEDVSVFASANQITVNAAPMEIYVQVGSAFIPDGDKSKMLQTISDAVKKFKELKNINIPINISIVEMLWKVGVGI